jgi:opacity protein-like surface antigen
MKKNILLLLILLAFSLSADVQAQGWCVENSCCYEDSCCVDETNFYAKILSGANFLQKTTTNGNKSRYQTGYLVAGSLGYRWCYGLCLEAEYAYRRNTMRKIHFFVEGFSRRGHFQSSSYMVNLLWKLPLYSCKKIFWNIQPFFGFGIGHDFQKMHSSNSRIIFNQKWNRFSWQVMTGLTSPIFCNTEISLEYRFHQGGSHFKSHSVGVGLEYKFGYLR